MQCLRRQDDDGDSVVTWVSVKRDMSAVNAKLRDQTILVDILVIKRGPQLCAPSNFSSVVRFYSLFPSNANHCNGGDDGGGGNDEGLVLPSRPSPLTLSPIVRPSGGWSGVTLMISRPPTSPPARPGEGPFLSRRVAGPGVE